MPLSLLCCSPALLPRSLLPSRASSNLPGNVPIVSASGTVPFRVPCLVPFPGRVGYIVLLLIQPCVVSGFGPVCSETARPRLRPYLLSRRCVRLRCFPCLVCVRRRSGSGRLPAAPHPVVLSSPGRCICHSLYGGRLSVFHGALHPLVIFCVTASPAPLALPVSPAQFALIACVRRRSGSGRLPAASHPFILSFPGRCICHSLYGGRLSVSRGALHPLFIFTPDSRALPIRISPPDRPVVLLRPRAAFLKRKGRAEPAPFLKKPLI